MMYSVAQQDKMPLTHGVRSFHLVVRVVTFGLHVVNIMWILGQQDDAYMFQNL